MKLSDITQDRSPSPAPDGILEAEAEAEKFVKLETEKLKGFPKRFKLRPVDAYIPKEEQNNKWSTLDTASELQALIVVQMLLERSDAVLFANLRACNNTCSFNQFFWGCISCMAIASIITFFVTIPRFRMTGLVKAAVVFQYLSMVAWSILFVLGAKIIFSSDKEVSDSERFYVRHIVVNNMFAVAASMYNAKLLNKDEESKAWNKMQSFEKHCGDIVFEMSDPEIEEAILKIAQ